jgi:hypothetical protein
MKDKHGFSFEIVLPQLVVYVFASVIMSQQHDNKFFFILVSILQDDIQLI